MFDETLFPISVTPQGGSSIILQDGEIYSGTLATAAGRTQPDGGELYGSSPKVIDDWLDDQPGQIKGNFYEWFNRAKVLPGTGLGVSIQPYTLLKQDGSLVEKSEQALTLVSNSTVFVTISEDGEIGSSSSLPLKGVPLALVITGDSGIISVVDIREQTTNHIRNLGENSGFSIGDIKETCSSTGGDGFVPLDNDVLYTATEFPLGFAEIGRAFSRPGDASGTFRVPPADAFARTSSTINPVGTQGGEESVKLTPSQNGRHTHPLQDLGHSHNTSGGVHSHGVNDPFHGHEALVGPESGGDKTESLKFNDSGIAGDNRGTPDYINRTGTDPNGSGRRRVIRSSKSGVTVQNSSANVSISNANSRLNILSSGEGESHNNLPPFYSINKFIRIA